MCWSSTKQTTSSSHCKLTCSRHDIPEKIAELALNNNHPLTPKLNVLITQSEEIYTIIELFLQEILFPSNTTLKAKPDIPHAMRSAFQA